MSHELERGAAAIAAVRGRYCICECPTERLPFLVLTVEGRYIQIARATLAECQAWIDEEAARACYLAALPLGDDVLDKMARTDVRLFHTAYKPSTEKLGDMRDAFTAAIRHIAGRSE